MFSLLRIFSPPEDPVLSLDVRARSYRVDEKERSQFELLLTHFLNCIFNNEMVSSDGEAKSHTLLAACAIALPGLIVALFLFPPYHFPPGRPYWLQVNDRYFFVLYSLVAVGVGTIFEWDLFFPDIVDVFVFSSLPATNRNLFSARIAAVGLFLGSFILVINLPGIVFFPAACDLPSPLRHFTAHFVAVTLSGVFSASAFLALQSLLLTVLGRRLLQIMAPIVQGLCVTLLFTMLLMFPVVSRYLQDLLQSANQWTRCFPPFWFLGIYEVILTGPGNKPVFAGLARTGMLVTLCTLAAAALLYPPAYWRRTRQLVEGQPMRNSRRWWTEKLHALLHATLLVAPRQRAVHHFITQTLVRTHRHRVYLAMYGGLGIALILSSALLLQIGSGKICIVFSTNGLRAATPILVFWVIAGLHAAFLSPVDERAGWLFRAIEGRPCFEQLAAARTWVLMCVTVLELGLLIAVHAVGPPELHTARALAGQLTVAAGLCLLLRDIFFLKVKTIPFTGARSAQKTNLAFTLIQYFGLFPPLILVTLGVEAWMRTSISNIAVTVVLLLIMHIGLQAAHRRVVTENANLLDIDEDEDEFPQRLGLRY